MDLRRVCNIHEYRIKDVTDDKVVDANTCPTIVIPDSGRPKIAIYEYIFTGGVLNAAPKFWKLGLPKCHL